jgi:hypothetical protein
MFEKRSKSFIHQLQTDHALGILHGSSFTYLYKENFSMTNLIIMRLSICHIKFTITGVQKTVTIVKF